MSVHEQATNEDGDTAPTEADPPPDSTPSLSVNTTQVAPTLPPEPAVSATASTLPSTFNDAHPADIRKVLAKAPHVRRDVKNVAWDMSSPLTTLGDELGHASSDDNSDATDLFRVMSTTVDDYIRPADDDTDDTDFWYGS